MITNNFCVYTALTGGYENLNENLPLKYPGTRFVCLTNDESLTSGSWEIQLVRSNLSSLELSRHMKMFPEHYLGVETETLYIDNTVELTDRPRALFESLVGSKEIGFIRHSFHHSMIEELNSILSNIKVDVAAMLKHVKLLQKLDVAFFEKHPIWGGVIARRKSSAEIIKFQEDWWNLFCDNPQRDQLSLAISASRFDSAVQIVNLNNHKSSYHYWPNSQRVREVSTLRVDQVQSRIAKTFPKNRYSSPALKLKCLCGKYYLGTFFQSKLKSIVLNILRNKPIMTKRVKQFHRLVQGLMTLIASLGRLYVEIVRMKPKRAIYPIRHPGKLLKLIRDFVKRHIEGNIR